MKSPASESRKELMAPMHREGQDHPAWIADGSLEGEIAGTLWSRLAKGLLKDHVGRVQALTAAAVVKEWLLRGGNARALTYAVWCEIVLRTIKAGTEAPTPSPDASDDDMTDDDISDLFRARPPSAISDVSVSSQGARRAPLQQGGSVLSSEEFDGIAVESLRWLRGAWTEYPLEKPDQEADRLRLFAVVKCLAQGSLGLDARDALRTVMDTCPLPSLVKLAFADVRGRFLGRMVGRDELADGDLDVFEESQARHGVVSVLQLDRYADVRAGRLEQKKRKSPNIIPLATAAEQSLRRVDTFPFRAPDPLEVAQIQARITAAKDRGQLYILLSNRLSQGHARASAGLEDGLLVMEWVLEFFERMLPVCKPDSVVARSICYSVHGVRRAIDTSECRDGAEHLISALEAIERLLADSAASPERNGLSLDGRPLSEFEKINAKYMDSTLTRIDSLPSFLVKKLRLSDNGKAPEIQPNSEQPAIQLKSDAISDVSLDDHMPEVLNPQTPDLSRHVHTVCHERVSFDGSVTSDGDSDSERTLDTCYEEILARKRTGNGSRSGNGIVLVSEESLAAANSRSEEPSSPPAWLLRKQRSLGLVPLDGTERTEAEMERAWRSTVQIDASSWEAPPEVGLQVRIRRNRMLLEREYIPKAASPSGRAIRSKSILKRSQKSPKKISYLTAAALRGIIKCTEGPPLDGDEDGFRRDERTVPTEKGRQRLAARAFDLETERRAVNKIADEMEEDPVTPSFFAARRKGAAIAARLPKLALRRDWMALKLVKERAAAAAFARRQLAKSQKEKEQKKANWDESDGTGSLDGSTGQGSYLESPSVGDIQPGGWEPSDGETMWPRGSTPSTDSKCRAKRVTWAENCQEIKGLNDEIMDPRSPIGDLGGEAVRA